MKLSGVITLLVVAGVGYYVWKNWASISAKLTPAANPVAGAGA